ncbi:MAG: hypothetical protein IKK09_05800 [Clostridia bacterium]|nr:hypothetical protein [Clostridia bacterium]
MKIIERIIKYPFRFIPLLVSVLVLAFSLSEVSNARLAVEIEEQIRRIESLEQSYLNGEIAPVDRNAFFNGDLQAELDAGLKFNELRYTATHNSYQTESVDELKQIYRKLSDLTFGLVPENMADFVSPTLTDQLNSGIYSLEIDIEVFDRDGDISFTCMHNPRFQMTTSCYDFALAMREIAMWSDNNPNHLPITLIIEPKESFLPLEDMKVLNLDYAKELDKTLRATLGDRLFTPADMLREYESFGEMRRANDWCKVKDMLGKVLILFHECNTTEGYIELDPTIKSQAMFPMLREKDMERDCASFLLLNRPVKEFKAIEKAISLGLIVRTRADEFTDVTEEKREKAFESGAQIMSTDYPVRQGLTADDYVVCFGDMKTISINK